MKVCLRSRIATVHHASFTGALLCLLLTFTGCASNPVPTTEPDSTAVIEKLIQQNKLLTDENAQLKKQKEDAELAAWVANNKEDLLPKLTDLYKKSAPDELMKACSFQGEPVEYQVTDAAYQTNTLFITQDLLWKKPDGSGEIAVFNTGINPNTEAVVYFSLEQQIPVTAKDMADAAEGGSTAEKELVSNTSDRPAKEDQKVDWKPNNETVNSAYQTGIKVAGAGLLMWLSHLATEGD